MAGESVLGLRPIAHLGVRKGPIHRYLEEHVALTPGKEFRGYVGLYLGADDGFVRKFFPIPNGAVAHETYVFARRKLADEFGNMFQLTDLWNSSIPTFEDYGHWLTKQMFMFDSDLLASDDDFVDAKGHMTHIYQFDPNILALLGVRYVVSDGTVTSPSATEVLRENGISGSLRLYEIGNVNLGNLSPTEVVTAASYDDAVSRLRSLQGRDTVILLDSPSLPTPLVPATDAHLTADKGGYHIRARSAGISILVLPVQFSHCWRLGAQPESNAVVFRANIVQTGIYFEGNLDADLRFAFGLANSTCRRQDAEEMGKYFASTRSKRHKHYLVR
jgi:hypothetical protein